MLKIKVSNFSLDSTGELPELNLNSFIIKAPPEDATLHENSIKNDYLIVYIKKQVYYE